MTNRIKAILTALLILSVVCGMAAADLPEIWDWREMGGVTPAKDQGTCGACYAFGAIGGLESFVLTQDGVEFDLSEEQVKECAGYGCSGGNPLTGWGLFSITGSVLEADDPYFPYDTTCKQNTPALRVTGWKELSFGDRDEIKSYIQEYGHVVTSIYSHSVVVVGWDDTMPCYGGNGVWISKFSYGEDFGDGGYAYTPYGSSYIENHVKSITGYEYYDASIETLAHVEKGQNQGVGYHPNNTAWGMSLFEVGAGKGITKIEFDTTGSTSDIDLYIYDGYDGYSLGNLLYQVTDLSYDVAGFYSVDIDSSLILDSATEVAVVGKFVNTGTQVNLNGFCPIATDMWGDVSGKTYISPTGLDGTWTHASRDLTLRLRVTDDPTIANTASMRRDIITIRGVGFGEESDWSSVVISSEGVTLDHDIVSWSDARIVCWCTTPGADLATVSTLHGTDSVEVT